jgi:hypothetical protein
MLLCVLLGLLSVIVLSCGKMKPEDMIIGPWSMEGGDTVYTFRQNQGWISLKTNSGESEKGKPAGGGDGTDEKVEGKWALERQDGKKALNLVITPSDTVEGTAWKKDRPEMFEVMEITENDLVLKRDNGDIEKWKKLGKDSEGEKNVVPGAVTLPIDPVVVGLMRERGDEPIRYLCINIQLHLKNGEGLDYVKHIVNPESKKESYHIHPRILDVTNGYFSTLYYKDVRTLDRVKVVVDRFHELMQPYFKGKLSDVIVSKVVVTPKYENAMEFKKGPQSEKEGEKNAGQEKEGAKDETPKPGSEGEVKATEHGGEKAAEEGSPESHGGGEPVASPDHAAEGEKPGSH